MIHYVTGTLGAGKSYYGARKIARALLTGRVVATNMQLVEGWERIILSHAHYYKLAGKSRRAEYEREIRTRYQYVPDIEILIGSMIHGYGEARGIRVIDEAHNEVNNREWMSNNQKTQLRKMALARKRGWDDYILAQHKDNTDMALRRIASVEVMLMNWRQLLQVPFFQTKVLPFHLFLALAYSMNLPGQVKRDKKVLWRELYPLGWEKNIYNTHEDFDIKNDEDEGLDDEMYTLWLPVPPDFDYTEWMAKRRAAIAALRLAERDEPTSVPSVIPFSVLRAGTATRPAGESPESERPSDKSRTPTDPVPPPTSESEG